jgi:hypothetical protein
MDKTSGGAVAPRAVEARKPLRTASSTPQHEWQINRHACKLSHDVVESDAELLALISARMPNGPDQQCHMRFPLVAAFPVRAVGGDLSGIVKCPKNFGSPYRDEPWLAGPEWHRQGYLGTL